MKTYKQKWYAKNRLRINKERRERWAIDPEFRNRSLKHASRYSKNHKEMANKRSKKYWKDNYKKNVQYTLKCICKSRIRMALKAQHAERLFSYEILLDCSWIELQKHMEKKFKPGMKWKQQDKKHWQIDHIRPVSSFDLHKGKDQKAAFNYRNMQPLFCGEHWKKSGKYLNALENKIVRLKAKNKEYRKALKEVMK